MERLINKVSYLFAALIFSPTITLAAGHCTGQRLIRNARGGPIKNADAILCMVQNAQNIVLAATGIAAVGMILWAAFRMFIAGGDPDKLQKAKGTLKWAVIGAIVVMLAEFLTFAFIEMIGG